MAGANSLFQNAQDPSWLISGYDPNANQIITVDLFAIAQGADPNIATKVGNLVSTIQVGAVPEPAAVALIGFGGLVSLLAVRRRRKSP
jgi:hypothetical protein